MFKDSTTRTTPDPIIHYVDLLLEQALQADASDVHLEPFEKECKIRYRIDGVLYEMKPLPISLALPMISRLKVMAHLDIAERRLPQDGRIEKMVGETSIDFRIATLPTQFGESLVLRVLDRRKINLALHALQMPLDIEEAVGAIIKKPHGLFIVTGPTGSGKTTTLYSCLQEIHHQGSKLLTAEDPIEYEMEGIMQVPIHEEIGLSFASVLRSFLRQDPDVIMIGEMRDIETAQMAVQASLTGHLVLTTLHTNDAAAAIWRLIDMDVEPLMIATTVEAILAQRLVRKICEQCRVVDEPEKGLLSTLEISGHAQETFYRGQGCEACHQTGYRGRMALFELLVISDPIRTLIYERASHADIREKARALGMKTLREYGVQAALEGITTLEEVVKWT